MVRTLIPWPMALRSRNYMLGFVIGLFMTFLYIAMNLVDSIPLLIFQPSHTLTDRSIPFQPWAAVRMGITQNRRVDGAPKDQWLHFSDNDTEGDDIARELSRKVRVLVWVMTNPTNLMKKAKAIRDTWGKRPNIVIYFSSVNNESFPAVGLGVPEGRNHLTAKTMAAFRYIYENHFNEADWFMKADDDTYVIVENLRFFLSDKNPQDPVYFGCLFRRNMEQGYYSGGGGYVISKEALRRFGTGAINSSLCQEDGIDEDVDFGRCMEKLGVVTSVSEDNKGRSLFHADHPSLFLLGNGPPWIARYKGSTVQTGFGVSKYAVSFHYVSPTDMRLLDYYLYHIRPYGIHSKSRNGNGTKPS